MGGNGPVGFPQPQTDSGPLTDTAGRIRTRADLSMVVPAGREGGLHPPPSPPPLPPTYPLDAMGRVRTRADLAKLINDGSDNMVIKTEICGGGDEPMDDNEENEVVCIVSLDEENRVVSLDDSFGHYGTDQETGGEELLDESYDSNGDEREEEEGESEEREGSGEGEEGGVGEQVGTGEPVTGPTAPATLAVDRNTVEENRDESGIQRMEGGNPEVVERIPEVAVKHPDNMYTAVRSIMEGGQDPRR